MNSNFNPYLVDFVDKQDIVEKVEDGYSGALLYKVTKGKNKYFLKIFNGKFDETKIANWASFLEIYKKLNIRSLDIIDYGSIDGADKYYVVYNFIKGLNLRVCTDSDKYNLSDIRKLGKYIGTEMLKLKNYKQCNLELFPEHNINMITNKAITNFYNILQNDASQRIITKHFKMEDIDRLKKLAKEYSDIFNNIEPKLIHGDIKRANIMMDSNQNLHIVDIESMQINYDILNFKYQMTWSLFDEKEAAFVKGYFDGIYDDNRPADFNKQVIFMMIVNFFNLSYDPEDDEFEMYVRKCRDLFYKIGEMDLSSEYIV